MNIMNKSKPIRTKRRYLFLNNRLFMKYNIKQLPPQLRNMIYIICMRNFWRQYIPLTSKVPTWYNLRLSQEEQLFHARQNNIHFLHIDSNTLPEYKKYIIGLALGSFLLDFFFNAVHKDIYSGKCCLTN